MTPVDRAALDALNRRLEHVASTALLIARQVDERTVSNALHGISATLEDLATQLDVLLNPHVRQEAA